MRYYQYGIWPVTRILNDCGMSSRFTLYNELMNQAMGALTEIAQDDLKSSETATITIRKNGRIYRVSIQDITEEQESDDEIISVSIDDNEDNEDDEDSCFTE